MSTLTPHGNKLRIALVLQGGGALGAYQAGVFQALNENGLQPDWVVGTSIGAINAAIIAGNTEHERLPRLQSFWHGLARRDLIDMRQVPDTARKSNILFATFDAVMRGVPGFFRPRAFNPFAAGLPVEPEAASFYDTRELADTLRQMVDFERLHAPESPRLTVSAMQVTSGELACFDSRHQRVGIEHVMASGALPPGFPPVRIDGKLYWDGGLYSNTPLELVLDDEPRTDTLCFMVDLWSADGPEPRTLDEVQTRQKDVTFASRSQRHIEEYRRLHNLRNAVHAMHAKLPATARKLAEIQEMAGTGCNTTMHIVRLPYGGKDWHLPCKDVNFSSGSIQWRWDQGYRDACRAIAQAGWHAPQPAHIGVVVHELPLEDGDAS